MILPEPAAHADFALLTGPEGEFYLAYELPRDFLSAPRQFAIVVGSLGADGQLACLYGHNRQADTDAAAEVDGASDEPFLQELEGVYYVHLANTQQVLQLSADHLKLQATLFNSQGPQAALLASLGSPLTG